MKDETALPFETMLGLALCQPNRNWQDAPFSMWVLTNGIRLHIADFLDSQNFVALR